MLLNTKSVIGTVAAMAGVPAVLTEFWRSWSRMVQFNVDYLCGPNERIYYTDAAVSDHAFARNVLASQMQGDWILMLDTDHGFEPDLVTRMVREFEKNDLDVLSGAYVYKTHPHAPVLYVNDQQGA